MFFRSFLKATVTGLCVRRSAKPNLLSRSYNEVSFEDIPEVSPALIKKMLKLHNISFDDGFACFITCCPMCKNTAKTSTKNVYINKTTGMFTCSSCKYTGQWEFLEKIFTNKKNSKNQTEIESMSHQEELLESLQTIRNSTESIKALVADNKLTETLAKLKLPKISSAVIEKMDIRIDRFFENIYFPLENVSSEVVGYRKVNIETQSDTTLPDITYGGLLTGKGTTKHKEMAILVPNISDFFVLLNAKISGSVVCLPNGINNLSQYVLPSLERYKKLVLWFGNDITSWNSARQFAKKLGEKRCLFIRPSENQASPHLNEKQDFKSIINSAQSVWHKSITTFASLREDVLLDLKNKETVEGVKWKRFPTLNKILKGHRRGELTVITGSTGSGKTTFISEYSLDLALQGVNTLWGSFEIRNQRLAKMMLQQLAGLPLEDNLHLFDHWADKFEKLPIYFMTFHGQESIKVVMEAIEHAAYVHDIAHVIIDNVQFMMGVSDENRHLDRFWAQDLIIARFRSFATKTNCHVSLVIHPRKERDDLTINSIFGGAKASQESDNVLIIQDTRLMTEKGKRTLQISKNRYSGDLGMMPLEFNKKALSYAQKKKKEAEKQLPELCS